MNGLEVRRFGGEFNGVDASGWHVVRETEEGTESVAGPFCDAGVARRIARTK